jgi:hypothetical protein
MPADPEGKSIRVSAVEPRGEAFGISEPPDTVHEQNCLNALAMEGDERK